MPPEVLMAIIARTDPASRQRMRQTSRRLRDAVDEFYRFRARRLLRARPEISHEADMLSADPERVAARTYEITDFELTRTGRRRGVLPARSGRYGGRMVRAPAPRIRWGEGRTNGGRGQFFDGTYIDDDPVEVTKEEREEAERRVQEILDNEMKRRVLEVLKVDFCVRLLRGDPAALRRLVSPGVDVDVTSIMDSIRYKYREWHFVKREVIRALKGPRTPEAALDAFRMAYKEEDGRMYEVLLHLRRGTIPEGRVHYCSGKDDDFYSCDLQRAVAIDKNVRTWLFWPNLHEYVIMYRDMYKYDRETVLGSLDNA